MVPNFIRTTARGSQSGEVGAGIRGSWRDQSSSKRGSLFPRREGPETEPGCPGLGFGAVHCPQESTLARDPKGAPGGAEGKLRASMGLGDRPASRLQGPTEAPTIGVPAFSSEGLQPAGRCPRDLHKIVPSLPSA